MMQKIIRHLFCQPHMARRIVVLILSVTIMGACVSVFDRIQFGTDPASVLNLGVANKLNMLLGTYQMLFYGALLIVVMAMRQWEFIGLGSIANMVLVGYSKDLFDVIFSSLNILNRDAMGMTERICWLVPTLACSWSPWRSIWWWSLAAGRMTRFRRLSRSTSRRYPMP